jgi:hypothetical protein
MSVGPISIRDDAMRAAVLVGVAVVGITEALSVFGAMRRVPLLAAWIALACASIVIARRRGWRPRIRVGRVDSVVAAYCAACALILALTGIAAALSPPNSADAMAYHLPRVLYWAEQGSVRFFPTHYLNQLMLQPFAEYAMLQSYVLSGGRPLHQLRPVDGIGVVHDRSLLHRPRIRRASTRPVLRRTLLRHDPRGHPGKFRG